MNDEYGYSEGGEMVDRRAGERRTAAPVDKLLTIIAYAYQVAGAHDVPDHILDVLADPEEATTEQIDAMLPYVPAAPVVAVVAADLATELRKISADKDADALSYLRHQLRRAADEIDRLAALASQAQAVASVPPEYIAELESENDRLRSALGDEVAAATLLTDLSLREGSLNMAFKGGAAQLMAEQFADQFRNRGATNFLEVRLASKKDGLRLLVTLQRCDGKTPAGFKREAEAKVAELTEELAELRAGLAAQAAVGVASQQEQKLELQDPILIPRGLVGAACYLINKHDPENNLLLKLRSFTFNRPMPSPLPPFAAPASQPDASVTVPCEACDGKGGWVTAEWIDPVSGPECEGERCGDCEGTGRVEQSSTAGSAKGGITNNSGAASPDLASIASQAHTLEQICDAATAAGLDALILVNGELVIDPPHGSIKMAKAVVAIIKHLATPTES